MSGMIYAIVTPGQAGGRYIAGTHSIERFEEVTKPGQGGNVPWIIAHHYDGSTTEFNVALLESIERHRNRDEGEP